MEIGRITFRQIQSQRPSPSSFTMPSYATSGAIPLQWESIDSAPKDGTEVLAWRAGWDRPSWVAWRTNSRTNTDFWNDVEEQDCYDIETEPPTHWVRLPVLPRGVEK